MAQKKRARLLFTAVLLSLSFAAILPTFVSAQEGQNDAGSGHDASDNCFLGITIAPGSYSGYLDSNDTVDFYNFSVASGQRINITMNVPPSNDFDLALYDPGPFCDPARRISYNGSGQPEGIIFDADSTGFWRLEVDRVSGAGGTYNFTLNLTDVSVTVNGYLFYLDQSSVNQSIKHAKVELWDFDQSGGDDLLDSTYTNGSGYYIFPQRLNSDSDTDNGKLDLYVKVYAENSSVARVVHYSPGPPSTSVVHNFSSDTQPNIPIGNQTINASVNNSARGAFNIFNATMEGYRYIIQQNNPPPSNVTIRWYEGYILPSEYNWIDIFINIKGSLTSKDEWDRDVIVHEYGHFVMHQFAGNGTFVNSDCPPSGIHIPGEKSGLICGYSEGWATFFQAAVKNNGSYINRKPDGDPEVPIWDLESQENHLKSARDEGTVSNILWDIHDSNSDGNDTISMGFGPIWDVTKNYLNGNTTNIYQFYSGWINCPTCTNQSHGYESEVQAIYAHHGLNTSGIEVYKGKIEVLIDFLLGRWVAYIEWTNAVFNIDRVINFNVRVVGSDTGWIDVGLNTSYTFYNLSEGNHTFYLMVVDANGTNTTYSINFTVSASNADVLIFAPHGINVRVNETLYADILLVNRGTMGVKETLRIVVKDDRGDVVKTEWKRVFLNARDVQRIQYEYQIPANAQTGLWTVQAMFTDDLKKRPPGFRWFRVNP